MKFAKNSLIVFFLCIGIALASDYGTIRDIVLVPYGRVSVLGHNAYADYFFYLSMIGEGTRGKLVQTSRYTTEQFPEKFAQPFFLIAGNVGRMFFLQPYQIYWASRIFFGGLLLFLVYIAGYMLFGTHKNGFITLGTVLLSVPWWYWNGKWFQTYCDFWTGFDPVYRITFLPHHMAANCMGLLLLILTHQGIKTKKTFWYIFAYASAIFGVLFNPAIMLIYLGSFYLGGAFVVVRRKMPLHAMVFGAVLGVGIIATYAYIFTIYGTTFPWNVVSKIEKELYYPIDFPLFLLVLGHMSIVSMAGMFSFRRWSFLTAAVTAWFLLPIFIFAAFPYIAPYIPLVVIRFVQSAPYIPVGILATACILRCYEWISKKTKLVKMIGIIFIAFIYCMSFPSFSASVKRQDEDFMYYHTREPGFYVPADQMELLVWLHDNAPPDSVVLAAEPLPYMIPAFTHSRVPYGNAWNTYDAEKKTIGGYHVFTYNTDELNTSYLDTQRISYLVTLQSEIPTDEFLTTFGFREVFKNASMRVYKRELRMTE